MKERDPICGMKGHIKAHGNYFCSNHCIKKYEEKNRPKKDPYCPSCSPSESNKHNKKWYQERLYQLLIALIILFVLNPVVSVFGITILNDFWFAFYDYLLLIWWAIILGFVIGGFVEYLIPSEYISKFLSKNEKRTIGWSVLLGFIMSACSHGILAISMEFYRKGASVSSVIAFLLASPWANLPMTILLFGFFGINALYFILSAILIAIITGLIYQVLERKNLVEVNPHTSDIIEDFSVGNDIKKRWKFYKKSPDNMKIAKGIVRGSWSLTKMVLWWVLIGMIFASFARVFIHAELFATYLGPTLIGLFITLVIATIIEVCSEGSSPIAFEIYNQTGATGNAFTFLMAGVATDYTEIGLIASNIGKRAALLLPLITVPQILIIGYLFNIFL
ncbi:MAG: permease [Candidatus Aenigmatarchaeota archaeon]